MDTLQVIDNSKIMVKIGDETSVLSRYCPHEGADLSLGYIKDGKLRCPWHNLCFNIKGEQPCKSLKNLKSYD